MTSVYQLTQHEIKEIRMQADSLDDVSRQLPDGLYSTFSTLQGGTRVFDLRAHLDRLYKSGPRKSTPGADESQLRRAIAQLAKQHAPGESRIRIMLLHESGEVYVGIQPFTPLSAEVYEKGVRVVTAEMVRKNPTLKDTAFIAHSESLRRLIRGDVFEVLLTKNGKIYEGMTSNFYAVKGNRLITAKSGILHGVTRNIVIRLAKGQGLQVRYQHPRVNEQYYDEALITSSSRGVVPVVRIGESAVGQGSVGKYAKELQKAYKSYIREKSELIDSN